MWLIEEFVFWDISNEIKWIRVESENFSGDVVEWVHSLKEWMQHRPPHLILNLWNSFEKEEKKKKQNCIRPSFEKFPSAIFCQFSKADFLFSSINLSMCSHPFKWHINWPFGTLSQLD